MRPPERARRLRGSSISNKAPLPGAWDKIEHAIEAARNRTHALAAAQNKLGVEWGGWIVKLPDGRFTFTTPFTSDLSVSLAAQEWAYNAFDIPGATPVLPFHSHPSSSSFSWNDYLVIAPGPYGAQHEPRLCTRNGVGARRHTGAHTRSAGLREQQERALRWCRWSRQSLGVESRSTRRRPSKPAAG